MAARIDPPFRADHVGSLLRPQPLLDARERNQRGELSDERLRAIEDEAIRYAVNLQEQAGLRSITDGEYRRAYWHVDFMLGFDGIEEMPQAETVGFQDSDFKPPVMEVVDKVRHPGPIMGQDFDFLKSITSQTPKVCIPSPSVVHFRGGRTAVSEEVYPDMDEFWADLSAAYNAEIMDLAARGCTYLQLDDVIMAYLCDQKLRDTVADRGEDPDELLRTYRDAINAALKGRPDSMAVTMHTCRGNFQSAWMAQGGYEPVAEVMFNEIDIDAYFMEWDTDRAGGFEPLRHLPNNKTVVLGLVTSKFPELESRESLLSRIEEASQYVSLDRLCLSPQCGFASTYHGNQVTEENEIAKLQLVVSVAEEVWGGV
ncbi:5-methyltetrahydropteroyltriglutamate--homocysteine S-methyltransferase [soil metagenome]